jgi:hypothetical protein
VANNIEPTRSDIITTLVVFLFGKIIDVAVTKNKRKS